MIQPDGSERALEPVDAAAAEAGAEAETFVRPQGFLGSTPYWAASALLHLIAFLLLLGLGQGRPVPPEETRSITVRAAHPPPPYDPELARDIRRIPKLLDQKLVPDPIVRRKRDEVAFDIPKGTSLDNIANLELDYSAMHDVIGVGGGASGAYGERWGKGSLVREGGSAGSEEAVRAALEWLVRHQAEDGSWKAHGFTSRCRKTCANANPGFGHGLGGTDFDVGVTGLALLAFAGYGTTHREGVYPEYVEAAAKAVRYLKSVQVASANPDEDGRFGSSLHRKWIYDHAIATMAMAEVLVMSGDVIGLRGSVRAATELCLAARNPGGAWRYGVRPGDDDTSVTGWMVLALKTARHAKLGIEQAHFEEAFRAASVFFRRATAPDGRTGYQRAGQRDNRSRWPGPYPFSVEHSCMTSVSVLCRLFAGESRSTPQIRQGVDLLLREVPSWIEMGGKRPSTINFYYWYYGSYAMFQFGGAAWERWNIGMQASLLKRQRRGGCEDGSWDTAGEWSDQGGRVYATAICAMTLEVYYRFRRMQTGVTF